tara:strand:+ start:433 stop:678 length:246 start_codon:yes stop_codon:yes gene_type:complete
METRNDLDYANSQPNENELTTDLGSQIKNYIRWYLEDCTDPHDELEWLINLVIDSGGKQKDEMIQVLEDTYRDYVENRDYI